MRDLADRRRPGRGRGARRLRPVRCPGPRRLSHPPGVGRRPRRGILAAGGRRELRGAPRCRRRHPLDRRRDAGARSRRTRRAGRAPRRLDAPARHDDVGGQVRLRPRPGDRARLAACGSCRGRLADLARRACGAARIRATPMRTSTSRSARCCHGRRGSPTRPTCSSNAVRSTRRRRGASSTACADDGLSLRLHGDQFTESGAIPLAVELGARSVDHLEATGAAGVGVLAASDVVGVLLPASALFLDRPMPPARALVDAGAAIALATDFNPGSAFTTSLPLVCSLALHAAASLTGRGADGGRPSTPPTCSASRTGPGGSLPACAADLVLLDAPDWRYLAYHLAGDIVARSSRTDRSPTGANLGSCPRRNSAAGGRRPSATSTTSCSSTTRATSCRSIRRSAGSEREAKVEQRAKAKPARGQTSRGGRPSVSRPSRPGIVRSGAAA